VKKLHYFALAFIGLSLSILSCSTGKKYSQSSNNVAKSITAVKESPSHNAPPLTADNLPEQNFSFNELFSFLVKNGHEQHDFDGTPNSYSLPADTLLATESMISAHDATGPGQQDYILLGKYDPNPQFFLYRNGEVYVQYPDGEKKPITETKYKVILYERVGEAYVLIKARLPYVNNIAVY
jgi:hypothetical protein